MKAELENATNQVYQKVGRNVVFFYKLEAMLKRITATSQISGYVSEVEQKAQKQIESISKQTLGQVAGLFIENNASGDDIELGPDNLKEPWINVGVTFSDDKTEERKRAFVSLVEERNRLIHQFDHVCNLTTLESCKEAEDYLDGQHNRILAELRALDCKMQVAQVATKNMITFMASDAYHQWQQIVDLQLCSSIWSLGTLSLQIMREDGWTILQKAVGHLNLEANDEIEKLKKHFKLKTTKDLMLKAGVFNFLEEKTEKGGIRLLYRVKPECNLWVTDRKSVMNFDVVLHP